MRDLGEKIRESEECSNKEGLVSKEEGVFMGIGWKENKLEESREEREEKE